MGDAIRKPMPSFQLSLWELGCTWLMCGIVLQVQFISYPLFAEVGSANWTAFAQAYTQKAGMLIAPIMLFEAGLCIWNLIRLRGTPGWRQRSVAAVLLGLVWISTFAVQVPLHESLSDSWDPVVGASLVASNAIRTLAWCGRACILSWGFTIWTRAWVGRS